MLIPVIPNCLYGCGQQHFQIFGKIMLPLSKRVNLSTVCQLDIMKLTSVIVSDSSVGDTVFNHSEFTMYCWLRWLYVLLHFDHFGKLFCGFLGWKHEVMYKTIL